MIDERMVTEMITAEQKQFIARHVDHARYDVERLTKYLSMHDIVGVEIFQYCEKEKPDGTGVFHKTVLGRNSEKASACWIGQY